MKSKILLDKRPKNKWPKCDTPNCKKDGMFKAPKDKNLKDYFNFCEKHVAEYNKNWNFYSGMTEDEIEIENNKDIYKRNPTWSFGIINDRYKAINVDSFQNIFDEKFKRYKIKKSINRTLDESLKIMSLSYPFTISELKMQYKKLVKKYHPDLSKNEKEKIIKEEKFKQIINAYQKLSDFLKK